MSLILRPVIRPEQASMLTLVMGLSVVQAVRELFGLDAWIKWPNDMVIDGKKVCGILTEMSMNPDRIHYLVLGIGINVNQTGFSEDLPHAYSLSMAAGHEFSRERIIARIWECFEEDYETYLRTGDMSGLKTEYEENLTNLGSKVCVLAPAGEWTGIAEGISDGGDLLVRDESGVLHTVNSGEVSVRGVYGYT